MSRWIVVMLITLLGGCARGPVAHNTESPTHPDAKPPATTQIIGREDSLSNVVQLTHNFDKAGEAYFSPDIKWMIFQASPKGQQQYQMYVARFKRNAAGAIIGADEP